VLIFVVVGIAAFVVAVFAIVMVTSTRMTGKQLDDDPSIADAEKDYPFDADY
jgi:uncharacterized membrane protein YedE/YeeE